MVVYSLIQLPVLLQVKSPTDHEERNGAPCISASESVRREGREP